MNISNFGDNCNLYILSKLSGLPISFTEIESEKKKIVAIGSILNWCNENCIAWGPGLANDSDIVNKDTKITCIRGPLTRNIAWKCGNKSEPALGDPVLLLPKLFFPKIDKQYQTGLIPHFIQQSHVYQQINNKLENTNIINILEQPEHIIKEILKCEKILSSSLHGIIAAHAYGIPATWATFGKEIGGDGIKFKDYYQSVDLKISIPINLSLLENLVKNTDIEYVLPKIDRTKELLQSAPFPILDNYKS